MASPWAAKGAHGTARPVVGAPRQLAELDAHRQHAPAQPQLARAGMAGGPQNPLGARALYLYQNGRDTLYRIHGTNEPWSIGKAASSGCIRMLNEDVFELFGSVPTAPGSSSGERLRRFCLSPARARSGP